MVNEGTRLRSALAPRRNLHLAPGGCAQPPPPLPPLLLLLLLLLLPPPRAPRQPAPTDPHRRSGAIGAQEGPQAHAVRVPRAAWYEGVADPQSGCRAAGHRVCLLNSSHPPRSGLGELSVRACARAERVMALAASAARRATGAAAGSSGARPRGRAARQPCRRAARQPCRRAAAVSEAAAAPTPAVSPLPSLEPALLAHAAPGRAGRTRVACLLSGGVDSSVALALLKAAGHDVVAYYLQIWFQEDFDNFWGECPWEVRRPRVQAPSERGRQKALRCGGPTP